MLPSFQMVSCSDFFRCISFPIYIFRHIVYTNVYSKNYIYVFRKVIKTYNLERKGVFYHVFIYGTWHRRRHLRTLNTHPQNILLWDIQETAMDWQISNSNLVL